MTTIFLFPFSFSLPSFLLLSFYITWRAAFHYIARFENSLHAGTDYTDVGLAEAVSYDVHVLLGLLPV